MREFAATRRRVFELYGAGDYQAAMELARSAASEFPELEDQTSYWIACLHALQGNADKALDVLRNALDQGLWWAPELLETDPDLEPLRADGRLAEVIAASEEARERWKPNLPTAPVVLSTDGSRSPRATMVLLHARGEQAEDIVELWRHAPDVLLIAPRSSQPLAIHAACWDDAARAEADVRVGVDAVLEELPHGSPILVAGFSQGGGLAIALAVKGIPAGVVGFVVVAPSVTWTRELIHADLHSPSAIRGAVLIGDRDRQLTETEAVVDDLRRKARATIDFEVVPDLGHAYPGDFDERLPELISRVMSGV